MGKQVGFYLLDEHIALIDRYVKENGFRILETPSATKDPLVLNSLSDAASKPAYKKMLVLESQTNGLLIGYSEKWGVYRIDELFSPVIEFMPPGLQDGQLYRGRLYLQTGYYENGLWIEKNEEFLKAADKLFRWFKKTFKRVAEEPFLGSYTSDGVIEWVRLGGKIAVN